MKKSSILKKLKVAATGAAMADMAMLLLIFFMATTTTEPPKGVEVQVPVAETRGADQDSIYVSIAKNGQIYYDGNEVSLIELGNALASRKAESDRVVAITADKTLDYAVVSKVLEVLKDKEFLNIVFMAEQRKKE